MKNDVIVAKLLSYVKKIKQYTVSLNYKEFSESDMVVEACVFNLSQIGELEISWINHFKKNMLRFHGDNYMDFEIELFMIMMA